MHQFLEAIHGRLQIVDDIRSQFVGVREAVQISQGLVLDPENIQTGFVPLQNVLNHPYGYGHRIRSAGLLVSTG